jgi:hypothetical protein
MSYRETGYRYRLGRLPEVKSAVYKPRREAWGETNHAGTLVSAFKTLAL